MLLCIWDNQAAATPLLTQFLSHAGIFPADMLAGKGAGADGVARLVSEWQQGIELTPSTTTVGGPTAVQRTAPVKQMEAVKGTPWRSGLTMRKIIHKRKPIWLAFERRILGHPHKQGGPHAERMSQEEALEDLELLAR